jgi:hypothetical protein
MLTTIEGVYKDGKIELAETPAGIERARVLVTFLDNGASQPERMMTFGQLAMGGRKSTEEDFRVAEWHGEDENTDGG